MGESRPEIRPPFPRPPALRVLLIQAEWPARALLKAELEAQGCDVLAADNIAVAVRLATAHGFRPTAIVLDSAGLDAQPHDLRAVDFLRGCHPLVLLSSSQLQNSLMAELSPTKVLRRPFSIGDVVTAVVES